MEQLSGTASAEEVRAILMMPAKGRGKGGNAVPLRAVILLRPQETLLLNI